MSSSNYELVFERDRQVFLSMDPAAASKAAGLTIDSSSHSIIVPMPARTYAVSLADGSVTLDGAGADLRERMLIMHHLIYCRPDAGLSGVWTPFHSLRGIAHFYQAFLNSTLPAFRDRFSRDKKAFALAGERLGAQRLDMGECAVRMDIFPMIPVVYVMWEEDDEFPAALQVLFDSRIAECTHPEDVPSLGGYGLTRLIEEAGDRA